MRPAHIQHIPASNIRSTRKRDFANTRFLDYSSCSSRTNTQSHACTNISDSTPVRVIPFLALLHPIHKLHALHWIVTLEEESDITSIIVIISFFRLFSAFYFILCNYLAFSRRLFQRSTVFILSHTLFFSFSFVVSVHVANAEAEEKKKKKKTNRKSQKIPNRRIFVLSCCIHECCNSKWKERNSLHFISSIYFRTFAPTLCLVLTQRRM